MSFKDHFSRTSSNYAAFRPRYPDHLFELLAERSPRRDLAWDCATGNGQAAVPLARHFDRVIATDASAQQIEHAEAHPRVEYRTALAERSTLGDASADLITVAQAMHWFDRDRFYDEVRRVAAPGALLAFWTYAWMSIDDVLDPLVIRFALETTAPYWPEERRLVNDEYRTIEMPFARVEIPTVEMRAEFTLEELIGYIGTWSGTTRMIAAIGDSAYRQVSEQIAQLWGDVERREVRWPLIIKAGRVS